MKSQYRVVVIGGGIVGVSVLYHLTKAGWADVALIERSELTAGSTWHAAAGFHAFNADPNIAALQSYTIGLYRELQAESEHAIGLKVLGAVTFAGTAERWEWLKTTVPGFRTIGLHDVGLVSAEEIKRLCPIVDVSSVHGGLWDPHDGYVDPNGTTQAFAAAARKRGADVVLRNRVLELRPRSDGWDVVTERGTIIAEHVVNAAGLWAKPVGRMAGVDLPVAPMEHHYLVTEPIPELARLPSEIPTLVDLEGFSYARQEGQGLLLGVYERHPKHWQMEGAPWDFGSELLPEDVDRIAPELTLGFERYPVLQRTGIKRWVNGPFTFTPDGNPLVGPVPGLRNYWCACGVMAGFSQGGGVGLTLARWIIDGEPGADVFGMDVARYGGFAANRSYLATTTRQFYAQRYLIAYPNEQPLAGRPLRVPGAYDVMSRNGARWGVSFGMEVPLYFAPPDFVEVPSPKRSNAHAIVAGECRATRGGVSLLDSSSFSRFAVSGPKAAAFLDRLLASRLPGPGQIRPAPMLGRSGHLMGDLTVFNWDEETFWLVGSYPFRTWHSRWFDAHLPSDGVRIDDVSDTMPGIALAGPRASDLLARLASADVSDMALPHLCCAEIDVGLSRARVGRLSLMGELGYEINVPAPEHRSLYLAALEAGRDLGVAEIGFNTVRAMRLETGYGSWSREYTQVETPATSGLDRCIDFDKPDFIGRNAALAERDRGAPPRRLVGLEIDALDADASGFEPVWVGGHVVGRITSGAFGHGCEKSLAMAYIASTVEPGASIEVDVVGVRRPARILPEPAFDPGGHRLRPADAERRDA